MPRVRVRVRGRVRVLLCVRECVIWLALPMSGEKASARGAPVLACGWKRQPCTLVEACANGCCWARSRGGVAALRGRGVARRGSAAIPEAELVIDGYTGAIFGDLTRYDARDLPR